MTDLLCRTVVFPMSPRWRSFLCPCWANPPSGAQGLFRSVTRRAGAGPAPHWRWARNGARQAPASLQPPGPNALIRVVRNATTAVHLYVSCATPPSEEPSVRRAIAPAPLSPETWLAHSTRLSQTVTGRLSVPLPTHRRPPLQSGSRLAGELATKAPMTSRFTTKCSASIGVSSGSFGDAPAHPQTGRRLPTPSRTAGSTFWRLAVRAAPPRPSRRTSAR